MAVFNGQADCRTCGNVVQIDNPRVEVRTQLLADFVREYFTAATPPGVQH